MTMDITGYSIIGARRSTGNESPFHAINPANGQLIEPAFYPVGIADVEDAAKLAKEAFAEYSALPGALRAGFLRACASEIESLGEVLTARAMQETGLPEARIKGETARTTGQLRLFASLVEEGSWVQARIDYAERDRKPLPKPDVRSMLKPTGPVAVFGASNFPLAFSVAGGDTASAFAAGCPVIVKAHHSHPGTAELVGSAIQKAVAKYNLPEGVFSLLFGSGKEVGVALVAHPVITAVGFTGSRAGGTALMRIAAEREVPIPVYAEMSSINPVVFLPGSLGDRSESIAAGLAGSVTLGVGQFCTNPGLVLLDESTEADKFIEYLAAALGNIPQGIMLNPGIHKAYEDGLKAMLHTGGASGLLEKPFPDQPGCHANPALFQTSGSSFLQDKSLSMEVFGPSTLVVRYKDENELIDIISRLEGQLTGTLYGNEPILKRYKSVRRAMENRVGRLIFNGFPTGVEVCHSMVHGGPYPSTSDGRSTSVGTHAIERFCRYMAYQDCPDELLPDELKDGNPRGIWRLVDGSFIKD